MGPELELPPCPIAFLPVKASLVQWIQIAPKPLPSKDVRDRRVEAPSVVYVPGLAHGGVHIPARGCRSNHTATN